MNLMGCANYIMSKGKLECEEDDIKALNNIIEPHMSELFDMPVCGKFGDILEE